MSSRMEDWQRGMKHELCHVHVNGDETKTFAALTDDYGTCVLKDVERGELNGLMAGHDEESKVNVCAFHRMALLGALNGAIVTGPFTRASQPLGFSQDVLGAPIYYTIHTTSDIPSTKAEIDELVVREVRVQTAVVGRSPRGFKFVGEDIHDGVRRLDEGEDVCVKLDLPAIERDGWKNRLHWSVGYGVQKEAGLRIHDRMTTTIPLTATQGHAAILQSRESARALMTALTILNGGYDVRLDGVELVVVGYRQPVPITFFYEPPKLMRYVPAPDASRGYRHYQASLRSHDCLDTDGLLWVRRFVNWWLDPKNRHVVHLLTHTDPASSFAVAEGLVRSTWSSGRVQPPYAENVLGVIFRELCLSIDKAGCKALADAHNHRKHVSLYEEYDVFKMSSFADVGAAVMDFVVVYAIIVLADRRGEQPSLASVHKKWRDVVMEMYKEHIDPHIKDLPKPMSQPRTPLEPLRGDTR